MSKEQKNTPNDTNASEEINADEYGDLFRGRIPLPSPIALGVSGLYEWNWRFMRSIPTSPRIPRPYPTIPQPVPIPRPLPYERLEETDHDAEEMVRENTTEAWSPILPWYFKKEELRLDVDGRYPQMTASGTMYSGVKVRVHWIASLQKVGKNQWSGNVWYKHGSTASLPYTQVKITATSSWYPSQRKVTVIFTGGGATPRTITYKYKSRYFHPVEFEFDRVQSAPCVTSVITHDHPNRPASLANETLTIENVYRRAGFDVSKSSNGSTIPLSAAGANSTWSDMEMHDAMQTYWSRFADKAQWSMWVLFASLHDRGTSLGGIMFDDIGPNHRQGTAIFGDAFISNAPSGDPAPNAWVRRMLFWTACHEMGHAFNLAHSWQKSHPPTWGTPWIPLSNENEVRSFMNYPYNVSGGESAFFSDFEYRFSDSELLFTRHAPSEYVQMGNADWFDHHGFQQAEVSPSPNYKLEIRVNREKPIFEFLEPVNMELKLTNISSDTQLVNEEILSSGDDMTVILKKQGKAARQWSPFARYCGTSANTILESGKAIYQSHLVSTGTNGWDMAEPGIYLVQVAVRNGEEDIISNPLTIRVAPPHGYDEEYIAQDFFSEDVGRVLAFRGSRFLNSANDTLCELVDRLPKCKATYHARVALSSPLTRNYKLLNLKKEKAFDFLKKDAKVVNKELGTTLIKNASEAVETLGHINYKNEVDNYCKFLSDEGSNVVAAECQATMHNALSARKVHKNVLQQILDAQKTYKSKG